MSTTINQLQAIRAALTAQIASNIGFLPDSELKALDRKIKKARNDAGNYTAEEFAKLPRWKRAVVLANDVIQNIRIKSFQIRKGTYLSSENGLDVMTEAASNLSLGTAEGKKCIIDAKCHVCAKGALFVSSALKTNTCKVIDVLGSDEEEMRVRLVYDEKIFDAKTFDTIEVAFEGGVEGTCAEYHWNYHFGEGGEGAEYCEYDDDGNLVLGKRAKKAQDECIDFFNHFHLSTERLVAIMLNVIKHKGKFKPTYVPSHADVAKALM